MTRILLEVQRDKIIHTFPLLLITSWTLPHWHLWQDRASEHMTYVGISLYNIDMNDWYTSDHQERSKKSQMKLVGPFLRLCQYGWMWSWPYRPGHTRSQQCSTYSVYWAHSLSREWCNSRMAGTVTCSTMLDIRNTGHCIMEQRNQETVTVSRHLAFNSPLRREEDTTEY